MQELIVIYGKGKVGQGLSHLLSLKNIPWIITDDAERNDEALKDATTIVVSPGVSPKHYIYQNYQEKILSELDFLKKNRNRFEITGKIQSLGITATNGKSTTTWLAYQALTKLFPAENIHLTGNFGTPVSETLAQIIEQKQTEQDHMLVMECSSFMLYQMKDWQFDRGILLNIAVDHLDRHRDLQDYTDTKKNILSHARISRTNPELYKTLSQILSPLQQTKTQLFDDYLNIENTHFLGEHNKQNLGAVSCFLKSYAQQKGIQLEQAQIDEVFADITPLEHRLQLVREIDGVKIYDDGICTASQALHGALTSFETPVVLVCGGYDKGESYEWLLETVQKKVSYAVIMGQTATKFSDLFSRAAIPYQEVNSLQIGLDIALQEAKKSGSVLLYSPGSASFDMFKNVYDRVEQFTKIIQSW